MSSKPEPFIDLEHRARIVKARGLNIRLPLVERLRAARGMRQAVVKVVSYARGLKRVSQLMDYISRKGTLELETETGEILIGRGQTKALAENWAADFGDRKNGRDAVHVVFSMPPGSDVEKLRKSVRTVLAKEFQDHEAVFGIHQDRNHPHAHVVVKMRGRHQNKKLRLNKPELYHLREAFAEAAREQGVPLAASPRAARGVGRKGDRQAISQMRKRGIAPHVDRELALRTAEELLKGDMNAKPWEKAMAERNKREKEIYSSYANQLRNQALKKSPEEQWKYLKAAADLERFSKSIPQPKTRRQLLKEKLVQEAELKNPNNPKRKDQGLELDI